MYHYRDRGRQAGFTLIELMMVVAALGVVLTIFASAYSQVGSLRAVAAQERDAYQNMMVGRSLLEFAQRKDGRLPAQQSNDRMPLLNGVGGGTPEDKEIFLEALWSRGLSEHQGYSDGTRAANQRSYRMFVDQVDVPLFGNSGDRVTIEVDYAAIFFLPDDMSESSLDANPSEWEAEEALDTRAYIFSSRALQEAKLNTTRERLFRVRQGINNYLTMQRLGRPPSELLTENMLPGNNAGGIGAPGVCGSGGWRTLNDSNVLADIGLDSSEFEVTAWGNPIFYCRNFGDRAVGNAPFYGALAVHKKIAKPDNPNSLGSDFVIIAL